MLLWSDGSPVEGAVVEVFASVDWIVGNGDDFSRGVAITDENGVCTFDDLLAGVRYYLQFRTPVGDPASPYAFTTKDAGGDDGLDSDANAEGFTEIFTLAPGEQNLTLHAGHVERFNGAVQELKKLIHRPLITFFTKICYAKSYWFIYFQW